MDIKHRIKTCGWLKQKKASGVLWDKSILMRVIGTFYWSMRLTMKYGLEC